MDESISPDLVELTPFIHQVGGHSFMLCFDEATVCKALVPRELDFYKTLPEGVKKFAPTFLGITKVYNVPGSDGYLHFYACPPPNYKPISHSQKRVRFKLSGSIEAADEEIFLEENDADTVSGLNPWVIKCHKECNKVQPDANDMVTTSRDFIVLENLTSNFTFPCILDLKVGTRQYGDEASLSKMQSKMVKVVSTTSAKLGLRVGGMQIYQVHTHRFICRNKFYGRSLSVAGFQQALIQFLHNGVRFRTDVLPILIRKLEELITALGALQAIRFYTTSLLLIYDGRDDEMRDGSDTTLSRHESLKRTNIRGSISSLRKRTLSAESLTPHDDDAIASTKLPSRRRTSSAANLDPSSPSETSSNSSSTSNIFEEGLQRGSNCGVEFRGRCFSSKSDPGSAYATEPHVDIKLIDFAHSTHKELDDPVVYTGPDRGFLFGLEKLISVLKSIETDYG